MSYQRRTPPLKLSVDKETFNKLIEILEINIKNGNNADIAKKLKENLLTFSIPLKNNNEDIIMIRFFYKEAMQIISQLLISQKDITPAINYYDVLLKIRENKVHMKQKEE